MEELRTKEDEKKDRKKLEFLEKKFSGTIVNDSQYGKVVHISTFHSITKDGVHIWEWP